VKIKPRFTFLDQFIVTFTPKQTNKQTQKQK